MKRIGITGNIGSGKSTVCQIFSVLGVPVFQADDMARTIYEKKEFKQVLLERFGEGIFDQNYEVDRRKLARIVFHERKSLEFLNSHIHPYVREKFTAWLNRPTVGRYVIYEAAILFESGQAENMDGIITVTAPESTRIRRIMERDGLDEKEIRLRMNNQWEENLKVESSNWVIRNGGEDYLIPQVIEVNNEIINTFNI